jgi:hypothetical protein
MAVKKNREPDVEEKSARVRYATYLPPEVVEKIRRAAYHLRLTTGDVVESAVLDFVRREETKNGKPFGPIKGLKPGRRLRED